MAPVPTLYEWLGGAEPLARLIDRFYQKVPADPILAPLFAGMDPEHFQHVAKFIAEVLGGPADYTAHQGGHLPMIQHHLGKGITEQQRQRWLSLLLETADEQGLPSDPEFRSALLAYLEWGSRLAVINSALPAGTPLDPGPMPRWDWGVPGGPTNPALPTSRSAGAAEAPNLPSSKPPRPPSIARIPVNPHRLCKTPKPSATTGDFPFILRAFYFPRLSTIKSAQQTPDSTRSLAVRRAHHQPISQTSADLGRPLGRLKTRPNSRRSKL